MPRSIVAGIVLFGGTIFLAHCAVRAPAPAPTHVFGPSAAGGSAQRFADGEPIEAFVNSNRKGELAAIFPQLDAHLAQQVADQKLPGLVFGVVLDGELVYAKGFGVQDLETKAPVDVDTVYRIGSLTKTFTSLAVLELRDEGKLSLDDPAVRHLPELASLRYPTRDSPLVTLRELLTHTSGLPRFGSSWVAHPDREVTERELLDDAAGATLLSAPGTTYSYSNLGVALLGPVVSRVSGVHYRDYLTKHIFVPLGMRSTVWSEADVAKGHLATGYAFGPGGPTRVASWRLGAYDAAGGIYTSLRDLALYAAFQLAAYPPRNDAELPPLRRSSVREAHATGWSVGLSTAPAAMAKGIGLGWEVYQTCALEQVVWHSGETEGHSASMQLLPRRGVAVMLLSNYRDTNRAAITQRAIDLLLQSKALAPRTLPPQAGSHPSPSPCTR